MEERLKPSKGTIIRTLVLFFALANQTLVLFGKNTLPITENELYELISWLFTAGSSLLCWWRNNAFSSQAIEAQNILEMIRNEKVTYED